jgi:hypothetical protein
MSRRAAAQFDLFAPPGLPPAAAPLDDQDAGRGALVDRMRQDLTAELARLRAATRLPWPDYTASALAELRFESLTRWLPAGEAEALRAAHAAELDRLYAAEPDSP